MSSQFPYPGLRPFARDETDIFFGREEHTDQLIDRLGHMHFVAVVGPSGCGKSSLVRTGLLAGLEAGFLSSAGVRWGVAELRPGNHPFANLSDALLVDSALGSEYIEHVTSYFTEAAETAAFLSAGSHRAMLQAQLRRGPFIARANPTTPSPPTGSKGRSPPTISMPGITWASCFGAKASWRKPSPPTSSKFRSSPIIWMLGTI